MYYKYKVKNANGINLSSVKTLEHAEQRLKEIEIQAEKEKHDLWVTPFHIHEGPEQPKEGDNWIPSFARFGSTCCGQQPPDIGATPTLQRFHSTQSSVGRRETQTFQTAEPLASFGRHERSNLAPQSRNVSADTTDQPLQKESRRGAETQREARKQEGVFLFLPS